MKNNKIAFVAIALLSSLLFPTVSFADPGNFRMRFEAQGMQPKSPTPPAEEIPSGDVWVYAAPIYGDWVGDAEQVFDCTNWAPLESDVKRGTQYAKNRTCSTEQTRTVTAREYNQKTSQYRVVSESTEHQTITVPDVEQSIGTKLELSCRYEFLQNEVNRTRGGNGINTWTYNGAVIGTTTATQLTINGVTYYQGSTTGDFNHFEICTELP